ncbi:MAG: haloacid dehalogenase type II [Actinomycetia bacterium]|nr:haloacid dehalogenase type II [Actinomycetes bacterium]
MTRIIVFDVNETLLDLAPVREWFRGRFEDHPDARMWFSELLRLSFVSSVTDRYVPFTDLAASALETVASRSGITIAPDDIAQVKALFVQLPPHPDVIEGLSILTGSGFTLVALTNSPLQTAHAQLNKAEISRFFETIMSVEMVNRFKPHRSVYEAAAGHMDTSTSEMVMVAAHDWDIAGAIAAGLDGVFIERPGQIYSPAFPPPTIIAPDIGVAATAIIEKYA